MRRHHDVHVCADPISRHRTQRNAVLAARRAARRGRVDLVTHARDGRIRSKDRYGNERITRDTEP